MNWETYIALGDSITIGARTYLGYPEFTGTILEGRLSKEWNVVNCAESGFTAIELARYIDNNYSSLTKHRSSITTILIGTNDLKSGTSQQNFEIALTQIIIKSKILTQNSNVVLLMIPELQEGIMYPYNIEMNSKVAELNQSIEKLAKKHNVKTLSLKVEKEDFFDGVHLSDTGVENIGRQVSNYILSERGI
ncbi:MAG: lysophospholipase L1-like esterase [Parvicellaceae bacterium]|jgi:lysophospholipase L1-like esterase